MDLPSNFISNIQTIYGEDGKTWISQLPTHLEDLSNLWNFRFIKTVENLSYSYVALVELNTNGEKAILKTTPKGDRGAYSINEAHWLQCIKKDVPKIYNVDEKKNAYLMEYLSPGHSLKTLVRAGQDETATQVICQVILALQSQQEKIFTFKHISELIKDLSHLKGHIENYTLSKAESLFRDLTANRLQSSVDALMPFRLWQYMLSIWNDHLKQNHKKSSKKLPLVIPIVFYHGEKTLRWTSGSSSFNRSSNPSD